MTAITMATIKRVYKNNGQHAEQVFRYTMSGCICKADNTPATVSGDYEDIQIKSARATICKGKDIASHLAMDAALPADVQDVFMGHAKWFRIEGLYKLGRRVNVPTAPQEASSETVEVIPHTENPVIAQNHQVLNEEPDEDDESLDDDGSNNVPEDSERKSSMIEPMDDE